MTHSISLIVFTLLGQCAAGMMILLCFRRESNTLLSWVAACILALAALASLGHLSAPLLSWRTLANVDSSWLSREILMCIIFGAGILAYAIFNWRWLCWLAAILGIVFVYVMSRVYTIPTEAAWNTPLTFWNFMAAGLLLGATVIVFTLELSRKTQDKQSVLLGGWAITLMCCMALSLLFIVFQMFGHANAATYSLLLCISGLVLGGGIGVLILGRYASRIAITGGSGTVARATSGLTACTALVFAILWGAEACGRYSFYQNYTWFGM